MIKENLNGLPFKEKVKRVFNKYYKEYKDRLWVFYKKNKSIILKIGNYGITSFFLGISFYLFSCLFMNHSFFRIIGSMMFFWCFLPFLEYYYAWFRTKWQEEA